MAPNSLVFRAAMHEVGRESVESASRMPMIDLVRFNLLLDDIDRQTKEAQEAAKKAKGGR